MIGQEVIRGVSSDLPTQPPKITKAKVKDFLTEGVDVPNSLHLLDLLDATVIIVSVLTENPDVTDYFAFIHHPLAGQMFYDFLRWSISDTSDPGLDDVCSDWLLPDLAKKQASSSPSKLLQMHAHLGTSWDIFQQHREKFIESIRPNAGSTPPKEIDSGLIFDEDIETEIKEIIINRGYNENAPFFEVLKGYSKEQLLGFIINTRGNKKPSREETTMSEQELKKRLLRRIKTSELARDWFFISDLWTRIFDHFVSTRYAKRTVVVNNKPFTVFIPKNKDGGIEEPVVTKKLDFGKKAAEYTLIPKGGRLVYERKRIFPKHLSPAIHWTTNTSKVNDTSPLITRTIHTDSLPDDSFSSDDDFNPKMFIWNPLLGLLVIACLSPEIRANWPKELGLPGSRIKQPLGPAQSPVFVLMRNGELARDSKILPKLEAAFQATPSLDEKFLSS